MSTASQRPSALTMFKANPPGTCLSSTKAYVSSETCRARGVFKSQTSVNLSHLAKDLKCLPPPEKHVSTQDYLENKKGKITNECTDGRADFSAQLAHSLPHQGDHQIFQVNSTQTLYSPGAHQKGKTQQPAASIEQYTTN